MSYKSPKWNNGSAPPLSAENMQALTDAVQEQGETLATMCNPNMLDNWYFGKPVNQMGQTEWLSSASANIPCVDRWNWWGQYAADATLKLSSDGLQLIGTAGVAGLYQGISQKIEKDRLPVGATVTLSALVKAEADASIILSMGGQNYVTVAVQANVWELITFTSNAQSVEQTYDISIQRNTAGATFTVKAVKLELGSQQTLAHKENGVWVLNEIPKVSDQLAKCQWYLQGIRPYNENYNGRYATFALGFAESATVAAIYLVGRPSMRTKPVITAPGNFRVRFGGVVKAVTSLNLAAQEWTSGMFAMTANVSDGLTPGAGVTLQANNDETANIFLSAEL